MLALEFHLIADPLEPGAQEGMVDRADDAVVAPELVGMERLPFAVGHAREIGDDCVDMRLRIERAAGIVLEQRVDEIAGLDRHLAAFDVAPPLGEVLLDPGHGLLDGGHIGLEHALVAGDISHDRS